MMDSGVKRLLEREGTNISWCDLTMNFWIGCQEVSPACDLCYAREFTNARLNAAARAAGRPEVVWGPGGARQLTSEANRRKPLRWQRIAAAADVVLNVFCSSLSDWADNAVPDSWRGQLALTILDTPNLRWMLLTKRIGNAEAMLRAMFPDGVPPNVALGITVPNQPEADRDVPRALQVKMCLNIRRLFLSCEPLLGPLDLRPWLPFIDLVIAGGESGGAKSRPMHPVWPLWLRNQCAEAEVPYHFKQWGDWLPVGGVRMPGDPPGQCRKIGKAIVGGRTFGPGRIQHVAPDGQPVVRVGTKAAGHLLQGVQHREHFR